ncbi:MAG: C25 family cysteine peptidase, partial [bacterium]|nr:C25 family cysteine peptidase [bacterium]
ILLPMRGIQYPVLAAQPSLSKSQSPEDVPFAYNAAAYLTDGYGSRPLVSVEELGIMRGLRLFALTVEAVQYDPAHHTLRAFNDFEIDVRFTGGDRAATDYLRQRTASPFFESAYSQYVLNYRRSNSLDEDLVQYPVKYVIVSASMFSAQLAPFIEWKTQQGYDVIVGYVGSAEVGSTTTSIKNYLQGLYNAGTPESPAPSFVLFVGDTGQVPVYSGQTDAHYTDLHYVRLDGLSNYLPEIYFGRFSARTTAELQPQIDKTLEYERYEMPDPSYLGRVVMIGGVDSNYGPVWANGQISYGTTYYFNSAHGITSNTYLYPASGSSDALIIANASDGRAYMNYTAHGGETSWSDPSFTVSDVSGLTNAHKYGTVVGNCCLTNSYQVATCLGEAWLRGVNKGAIGYIGASNYSYWDEDYWWGVGYRASIVVDPTYSATARGAYDGMFHDHSEAFENWYTTQYGFIMAGNLAVTQAGSSLSNYYWEVYMLMGDPSLSTFLGVPTANTVSYPAQILVGQTQITVTAEAYSYVGLSYDGDLIAAGLVDASGSLTLNFSAFTLPGDADIVITRQSRVPVISTIQIVPNAGPYLSTSAEDVSDLAGGDGDGLADFGETLDISLTESNIGSEDALGVAMTIASANPYLTITDNAESYGTIPASGQVTMPNGFEAIIASDVPDGEMIQVDVTATDDELNEWTDLFTIEAHAPVLSISTTLVDDASGNGNGVMDAGESVGLTLTLLNDGSAEASTLVGTLSTDYEYATITEATGTLATLNPAQSGHLTDYEVTISPSAPAMDRAFFYLDMAMAGGRTERMILEMTIGGFSDAIENGSGSWTHAANQTDWSDQWHISSEQYSSPTHAWKCGDSGTGNYASHMDAVLMTPTINLPGHAELSFRHKIDAEVSSYYPDSAYDGGIVEISAGGGAWTRLTPTTGGYNKIVRYMAGGSTPYSGPLTSGTPCWSGAIAWTTVVCDLAAYSGDVQIRFRFGSDSGGGLEGWYVDDVQIRLVVADGPPQHLTAEIVGSEAVLDWQSPSSGALASTLLGYTIYRDGGQIASLVQALTYSDDLSALPYDTYTYTVTAQFSEGESAVSNSAAVNWMGASINPVTGLTVFPDGMDLILRWTAVPDADEYHVYSSAIPGVYEGTPVVVTDPTCTLIGEASSYETRFYIVTAVRN